MDGSPDFTYAVLLAEQLPESLLSALEPHLIETKGQRWITCSLVEPVGPFLVADMLPANMDGGVPVKAWLPLGFVLAIVDMRLHPPSIGFLSSSP